MQERKPGPRALLARGTKSHALCAGSVCEKVAHSRIQKIGDKCGKEWDAHWQCLEMNNQVSTKMPLTVLGVHAVPKSRAPPEQVCPGATGTPMTTNHRIWRSASLARLKASLRSTRRRTPWYHGCKSRQYLSNRQPLFFAMTVHRRFVRLILERWFLHHRESWGFWR